MKKIYAFTLIVALLFCICGCNNSEATKYSFDNSDILISVINENCKYILNEWWYDSKEISFRDSYLLNTIELTEAQKEDAKHSEDSFKNWETQKYLYICNWENNNYSENAILPGCYASRVVSEALFHGVFNENTVGIKKTIAQTMISKLIISLAKTHCSNTINGWGHCWQGALWAEMLGMSGYYMRDWIDDSDWMFIQNMVYSEADYIINTVGVSFYRNKSGIVNKEYLGDSQSETVGWNATIIALAYLFSKNDDYVESLIKFCVSSVVKPSDLVSNKVIDGLSINTLDGSNINEDGTVTNHDKCHIDYMASPIESFAECYIVLQVCDKSYLKCLKLNVDCIYDALINLDLGVYDDTKKNHHFYERTKDGYPSSVTNMPGINEWGDFRQANYYLVDVYSSIINADKMIQENLKANAWANCRIKEIKRMVDRGNDGKIYLDGEELFASGQLYAMACLTQAFSLLANNSK